MSPLLVELEMSRRSLRLRRRSPWKVGWHWRLLAAVSLGEGLVQERWVGWRVMMKILSGLLTERPDLGVLLIWLFWGRWFGQMVGL